MSEGAGRVTIVLAAFNGEAFIGEQIESIRAQTWTDWHLLLRDDGSTDGTREVIRAKATLDARITLLPEDGRREGAWGNFAVLLQHALSSGSSYALLADQDDVWLPAKVAKSLAVVREHERVRTPQWPVLVHTDLHVVDDELNSIYPSYRGHQRVLYDRVEPLRTLLLHNAPMGCTIAVNRALLEFALPLPRDVAHDWWLAQCAAVAGDVLDLPEQLVLYRQHAANVVGSPGARNLLRQVFLQPLTWTPRLLRWFRSGLRQALELSRRVMDRAGAVPPERAAAVHAYVAAFSTLNPFSRFVLLARSRVRPQRAASHPIFYALALIQPRIARRRLSTVEAPPPN